MKRRELLEALANVAIAEKLTGVDTLSDYWTLHEFIMQNTKDEEKVPALLKGSEDDT